MSNQQAMVALIRSISGQANVLTIPRLYIDLTQSHRAALMLSQCVYWSDRAGRDGWFYKTYRDWQAELGIPRGGIDTAMVILAAWVETAIRKVGGTPKKHYRVNMPLLAAAIEQILEAKEFSLVGNRQIEMSESSKSDLSESDKTSLTKITTETTNIERGAPGAPPAEDGKGKPKGRTRKAPDPRTASAEIQAYHAITGRYPHLTLYDLVIAAARGKPQADLLPFYQAWVGRGHNPNAATWLTEWAVAGSIPTNGGHRNGASKQATRGDGSSSPAGQGGGDREVKSPARIIAERLSRGESVG